jgi:hypothetical protein
MMNAAGRDFSQLEITWMVDNRLTSAATIRAYRDLGVHGLYVVAPNPNPNHTLAILREFAVKVKEAVG